MAGTISESLAPSVGITDSDITAAFPVDSSVPDRSVRLGLMRQLHDYYAAYMAGPEMFQCIPRLNTDSEIGRLEDAWLRWEDSQVDESQLPSTAAEFLEWFIVVRNRHLQREFCRYLANHATVDEMALFFLAEELVDSRFDDLVAMTQVGSAGVAKLTMAENYWDEMGEGTLERMHTRLFEHSAQYMRGRLAKSGIDLSELHCMEVYENACLVLMYGVHRHLVPRALAAMGLMEYSAPVRFQAMVDGCVRLGVPADVIEYQRIHVHVDADHGAEWLENVLVPLAHRSPGALRELGLGVLTRERVANVYYERIWQHMRAVR